MKSILIFDDRCKVCTAFGTWGKGIIPLGYTTEPAKKLMKAQFGKDYGFALMFFSEEKAYWGSDAAVEVMKVAYSKKIGTWFRRLIYASYPWATDVLNVVSQRKILPHPPKFKGERLPESGIIPLTKNALEQAITISKSHKNVLKKRD